MAQIKILYRNILENSTVNPTNASTTYPAYRLYDRDIGKLFKGNSSAATWNITIDQQSSATHTIYPVDRLIIPSGHNLNGIDLAIQYSSDNFAGDVNTATSWTQSTTGIIDKAITSNTQRYWRISIFNHSVPELPELFLGKDYSFQRNPAYGSRTGKRPNVMREETQSGKRRAIKLGELKNNRTYELSVIETTQKNDFEAWVTHTEGLKPIYLTDENGNVMFGEILNDFDFSYKAADIYSCSIEFLEVL